MDIIKKEYKGVKMVRVDCYKYCELPIYDIIKNDIVVISIVGSRNLANLAIKYFTLKDSSKHGWEYILCHNYRSHKPYNRLKRKIEELVGEI